jgi:hypothetical protein
LLPVAGDPTSRFSGNLNLPAMLQPLVQISPASSGQVSPAAAAAPVATPSPVSSASSSTSGDTNQMPAFDQQWFNDHGNLIASAVRTQLLNYHPIVDTINDL